MIKEPSRMMGMWPCTIFGIRIVRVDFIITDLHYLQGELEAEFNF